MFSAGCSPGMWPSREDTCAIDNGGGPSEYPSSVSSSSNECSTPCCRARALASALAARSAIRCWWQACREVFSRGCCPRADALQTASMLQYRSVSILGRRNYFPHQGALPGARRVGVGPPLCGEILGILGPVARAFPWRNFAELSQSFSYFTVSSRAHSTPPALRPAFRTVRC